MAKIIISLPDELLKKVDQYALLKNYNRSELIRYALREIILLGVITDDEEPNESL